MRRLNPTWRAVLEMLAADDMGEGKIYTGVRSFVKHHRSACSVNRTTLDLMRLNGLVGQAGDNRPGEWRRITTAGRKALEAGEYDPGMRGRCYGRNEPEDWL